MKNIIILFCALFFTSITFAKPIWIDVRTVEEYQTEHLDGAVRISHHEIANNIEAIIPDKTQKIHLYCRSGRRAGVAHKALKALGYNNVINIGGLEDAKKFVVTHK